MKLSRVKQCIGYYTRWWWTKRVGWSWAAHMMNQQISVGSKAHPLTAQLAENRHKEFPCLWGWDYTEQEMFQNAGTRVSVAESLVATRWCKWLVSGVIVLPPWPESQLIFPTILTCDTTPPCRFGEIWFTIGPASVSYRMWICVVNWGFCQTSECTTLGKFAKLGIQHWTSCMQLYVLSILLLLLLLFVLVFEEPLSSGSLLVG